MTSFRTTELWRSALVSPAGDVNEVARSRLRAALEGFRERAGALAGEITTDLPGLTVHDVTHLDHLWTIADLIAGPSICLTPTEAFVLGGAFLLHDLGLALAAYPGGVRELQDLPLWRDGLIAAMRRRLGREPTAGDIATPPPDVVEEITFWVLRERHAAQAEALASTMWVDHHTGETYHLLEDADLRRVLGPLIGRIAHSHWFPTSRLPAEFPHTVGAPLPWQPPEWRIDALKLALLLRLADAADLTSERAPSFLQVLRQPEGTSALHWAFQEKLYQAQRDDDRLVYTSQPFGPHDARAWWLAYDTLRMVDTELRLGDTLNGDLHRERFAARGVRGVEEPIRLAGFLPAQGWTPVDAQVRVSHVADLVRKLGGRELYGDDETVPLRELLQNAADAVRARRLLQDHDERWGEILLRWGKDEHGAWLEVEDNGVGMSHAVLTGALLDFGVSFWSTPDAIREFPTLLSRGFHSAGRYGIGFFSVFMWTDHVRITTRRYDTATADTVVLEFDKGLTQRPLLRPATLPEQLSDGGTRVRLWPRHVPDTSTRWIRGVMHDPPFAERTAPMSLVEAAYWLCPTLDVTLVAERAPGRRHRLIRAGDWLRIGGQQVLARGNAGTYAGFADNVRPLSHNGAVVGRACVLPDHGGGAISIGGLRAKQRVRIPGLFLGESRNAARDEADVLVTPAELARWATEQAALVGAMPLSASDKAQCARIIGVLGGDVGALPIAKPAGGKWLDTNGISVWSREKACIDVVAETDEEDALAGGTVDDILVEPLGNDEFITGSRAQARLSARSRATLHRRPLLQAIAAAWAPDELTAGRTTRYIQIYAGTTHSKHDGIEINCEEITREKRKST